MYELLRAETRKLLATNKFISKSEYYNLLLKYVSDPQKLAQYDADLKPIINKHNNAFIQKALIEKKGYLDTILYDVDKNLSLDDEQRKAVLIDEDYCLFVAGAGSGKTTTMAAKVKYLVDIQKVNPKDIIIISFTKKAIGELKERVNKQLKLPIEICTFHAFGYNIIRKSYENAPSVISDAYNVFMEIIEKDVYHDNKILKKLALFFSQYLEVSENAFNHKSLEDYHRFKSECDLATLRSNLKEYNKTVMDKLKRKTRTICNEILRSREEVAIANFLYMNGIEYEYEKQFEYPIEGIKKPYTPDFFIEQGSNRCYIEHFGISENGKHALYSDIDLSKYLNIIKQKIRWHEKYHTDLIITYSSYNDKRTTLEHLKEEMKERGFVLKERDSEEIYRKMVETDKDKYVMKFIFLVMCFVSQFKTHGYTEEKFREFDGIDNVRDKLFLELVEDFYKYYQSKLQNKNQIDFEDMINIAEKVLKEVERYKIKIPYKYIVIDEYQDIAMQRFNLTKRIAEISNAKIIAVGDDWQSIYRFSGSDIDLFLEFRALMGYAEQLEITHTYRNSQELIDIAGNFIQKNPAQIKKKLQSIKHLENPVVIKEYNDLNNLVYNRMMKVVETIGEISDEFGPKAKVLILGRYNFDKYFLLKGDQFADLNKGGQIRCAKYPEVKIVFMTAHSSKGLGYDNVIILNASESKFGFPSQVEDDPVMSLINKSDNRVPSAEERRLFYVALTRTKNRVYIITPLNKPSRFIVELIEEHNVPHDSKINKDVVQINRARCPKCGFPLKYEFRKSYGLDLWICTNEHEICDFMTNNIQAMKDIFMCEVCGDGYMIVKQRKDGKGFVYGCTNYKEDGTGCNNIKSINIKKNC